MMIGLMEITNILKVAHVLTMSNTENKKYEINVAIYVFKFHALA